MAAAPTVHAASSNPISANAVGESSITISYAREARDATGEQAKSPRKCEDLPFFTDNLIASVAVMIWLERPVLRHTDIIRLLLTEL